MGERLPAFEVEKLEGKIKVKRYSYDIEYVKDEDGEIVRDSDGRRIMLSKARNEKEVEVDAGYMVYFPRGHSLHVQDLKEMERMGFLNRPRAVDMDSDAEEDGASVGSPQTLKERTRRMTSPSRRRGRSDAGSIEAEIE